MATSEDGVGIENVGLRETLTSLDRSIQSLILFFEESDVRPRGSDLWLSTTRGGKPETDRTTAAGCACSSSSSCSALELGGRRRLQPCVNGRRDRPCYPGPCNTLRSTRGRRREHELLVLLRAQHPELKAHRHPPAGHLNMERVAVGYFAAAEAARQVTSIVAGSCLLSGRCALIQWASPLSSSHAAAFLRDAAGSRPMGFAEQFTCCRKQVAAGPHLP